MKPRLASLLFAAVFLIPPVLGWAECSPEAQWRVSDAATCLDGKDVGCAKLKLEPVLRKEPRCGQAIFVHGWILEYFDGKVEEGQAMQNRAMEIEPKLSTFWEDRGHAIEAKMASQTFSNFDVQFEGAFNRDKAWDAVRYLNEMYADMGTLFGQYPKKRIPVIIFTTLDFLAAWRAPFVGGFFDRRDGKIRIRVDEMPGGAEEFQMRARHEMAHAFVYQLYPKELPGWATEGIAEYCARRGISHGFWKEERLDKIRKERKGYPWLSMADIDRVIKNKKGTVLETYLAYLQSEALCIWISKDRGETWMQRVFEQMMKSGRTFDEAYQAIFTVSPATELERLRHYWE